MARESKSCKRALPRLRYSFMKIMTGSDLSRRRLPIMSAISDRPGSTVWLTACIHGDEVCGIVTIQEVFRRLRRKLLRGAVHAFPLMNPIGFETASRNITVSREDLNRSFPGGPSGSLGERIANSILGKILETGPDLVLDLHTDWKRSIPYTLIDRDPGGPHKTTYEKTKLFARQVGFVSIVDTDKLAKSFSYNLLVKGVPSLTLELGEPNVINEKNVEYGVDAIWNILSCLDMIESPEVHFRYPVSQAYAAETLLRYSDKPYSAQSGIIRFLVSPGDEVRCGQSFAKIVNAFGKHKETLNAAEDAIVLGYTDSSVVFPGMPIMAFGIP